MNKRLPPISLLLGFLCALVGIGPDAYGQASMFADPKAQGPGDILTIVLAERTAAQRESAWENRSNSRLGAGATVAGDGLSGQFAADARFSKEARARNESVQSDLLRGTVSARVVAVDAVGNLQVHGERKISVNGEAHLLTISGVVRPYDILYNNTILSHQIADAEIEYRRTGFAKRMFKPGAFVKIGAIAALGAALLIAAD